MGTDTMQYQKRDKLTNRFGNNLPQKTDPPIFLLHHHHSFGKTYRPILPLLITTAKSCILLFWKQTQAPSIPVWLKRVTENNKMEDVVTTERGVHDKFLKKLFLWHEFVYSQEYMALLTKIIRPGD